MMPGLLPGWTKKGIKQLAKFFFFRLRFEMLNVLHTCILEALRHKNIMPGLLPGWTERMLNNCLIFFPLRDEMLNVLYTPISRKVVGKSARDNSERYCGWFWVHCSSKKFERIAREAMDICLWVLKESNKSRFDSYSRQEQCIDHIPYHLSGLSRAHFFRQPFLN